MAENKIKENTFKPKPATPTVKEDKVDLVINDPESDFNWTDGKSAGLVRYSDAPLEVLNLETYNEDSYHNRPTGASANNYVTNDWGKLGLATTLVSDEDVSSGKVCYMLNSDQSQIRWVQNLGTDSYPVPAAFGTGQVSAKKRSAPLLMRNDLSEISNLSGLLKSKLFQLNWPQVVQTPYLS